MSYLCTGMWRTNKIESRTNAADAKLYSLNSAYLRLC